MREMEWPPARGNAGLLIDRPRLTARRRGGLGQILISGDLDAAIAGLAPGAPLLGLYALAPESAHALRIGRTSALLITPAPFPLLTVGATAGARPASTTVGPWSTFPARTRRKRSCRRPRPTSPRVRPRPPFLSSACAACSRGRPPASASMSSRRGWKRCSPGSTGSDLWSACHSRRLRSCRSGIQDNKRPWVAGWIPALRGNDRVSVASRQSTLAKGPHETRS